MQPTGFPGAPYRQPAPLPYAQPVSPRTARQVTTLPRPQAEPPKLSQPAVVEILPPPEQTVALQVVVPSPQQLGIRLDDPVPTPIVVPDPAKLGIRVE